MRLVRDISQLEQLQTGSVATIGNFDGIHLGHQLILQQLDKHAAEFQLPKVVISFEPLPIEYFSGYQSQRVYPFRDKVRYLSALGIDYFLCLRFDESLANMPAEKFIRQLLLQMANVRHLVVGDDFRFGKQREGNFELLEKMGQDNNMSVRDSPTYNDRLGRISSTRVRNHLNLGEIDAANKLLGRHYSLSGRVRHGDKRGRTIGFPTMNLRIQENIAAINGVYAVKVKGLGDNVRLGVANLGNRPTVGGIETRLEVHLFDFNELVYGKHIEVELITFIRPEVKFESLDALTTQIQKDTTYAQKTLTPNH